jgi:uncharacterized protein (TIGR02646 family)
MVHIKKGTEPRVLTKFRESTPDASYDGLPSDVKDEIRNALLNEQGAICAYCMTSINFDTVKIEHFIAQEADKTKDLAYSNMLGVCPGGKNPNEKTARKSLTCDAHRENAPLTINPLNKAIIDTLYYIDGCIESSDSKLNREIDEILNLNVSFLVNNRKSALAAYKKHLHKKLSGDWRASVFRYIEKLERAETKMPYCGIILWYLYKKAKKSS